MDTMKLFDYHICTPWYTLRKKGTKVVTEVVSFKMMYHLQYVPIYTLGTDMYICGTKKHSLWVNKVQRCTFRKGNALVTTFGPLFYETVRYFTE